MALCNEAPYSHELNFASSGIRTRNLVIRSRERQPLGHPDASTLIMKTCLFKYLENFTSKNWKFSDKKLWYFAYFCLKHRLWYSLEPPEPLRQGGSNEYPQSMFLSRNKKNNVYPCKPQFYYIKVGFKGVNIILACFHDDQCINTDKHINYLFKFHDKTKIRQEVRAKENY